MKLFKRKHTRAMHLKADAIRTDLAKPFDWSAQWQQERANRNLPPEQRFAGEPWYERNRDGILRFPVGR